MTPFAAAWSVLKAPFIVQGGEYHSGDVGHSDPVEYLYSGAKRGDEPSGYWTPDLEQAMGFAMTGDEFGGLVQEARRGEPIVFRARSDDLVRVPADIEMYDDERDPIAWFEPGRTRYIPHDRIDIDVLEGAELADLLNPDGLRARFLRNTDLTNQIDEVLDNLRNPNYQWPETNDLGDRSPYFAMRRRAQEDAWIDARDRHIDGYFREFDIQNMQKAEEVAPGYGVKSPFRAYRAVPTSAVDEILSEGIVPRPMLPHYVRPTQTRSLKEITEAVGRGEIDDPMEAFRQLHEPLPWEHDNVIYTLRHKTGNQSAMRQAWDEEWYRPSLDPLLMAQFFADKYHYDTPMSIIGSRITPPGKSWVDPDFEPGIGFRSMISTRPIAPRHLEEVIPVLYDGRRIRYGRKQHLPDALIEDWEAVM